MKLPESYEPAAGKRMVQPISPASDHFPDSEEWQLRTDPLSRAAFLRQPLSRPSLAREALVLLRPERPSIEVDGDFEVALENPLRRFVLLTLEGRQCGIDDAERLTLRCSVPNEPQATAMLFANPVRDGAYRSVASIRVIRR